MQIALLGEFTAEEGLALTEFIQRCSAARPNQRFRLILPHELRNLMVKNDAAERALDLLDPDKIRLTLQD